MKCLYCGDVADTQDHVIPCSYLGYRSYFDNNNLAPCCRECNAVLGSKLFNKFQDKAAWLINYYKKKYKKLLNSPTWNEEELAELKGNLRSYVISMQKEKKHLEYRMATLKATSLTPDELFPLLKDISNDGF